MFSIINTCPEGRHGTASSMVQLNMRCLENCPFESIWLRVHLIIVDDHQKYFRIPHRNALHSGYICENQHQNTLHLNCANKFIISDPRNVLCKIRL